MAKKSTIANSISSSWYTAKDLANIMQIDSKLIYYFANVNKIECNKTNRPYLFRSSVELIQEIQNYKNANYLYDSRQFPDYIKPLIGYFKKSKVPWKLRIRLFFQELIDAPNKFRSIIWIGIIGSLASIGGLVIALFVIGSHKTPDKISPIRIGKFAGNLDFFSVHKNFDPSGLMGDIGDITIIKNENGILFQYRPKGKGPHEWDWKYVNGKLNNNPAKFSGVMYLDPPNNWGENPTGGYDLREYHMGITWEARSLTGEVNVEFVIGGINWIWDEKNGIKKPAPFPDTMPSVRVGIKTLTAEWRKFEFGLSQKPLHYFACIVGAFGWTISQNNAYNYSNRTENIPITPELIEFEVRNIQYERK